MTLGGIDKATVFEEYRNHGAVLLRGFSCDLDGFGAFAQHFCPVPIHNESGKRIVLDGHSGLQSVNLGYRAFPLHPEISREPWRPDTAFFHCVRPPRLGGQTTICDGIEIVRQIPDGIREQMAARRIKYVVGATAADLQYWFGKPDPSAAEVANPPADCPFEFTWQDGRLVRSFSRPLLHQPRFNEALAFGNFILFARYLRGVKTYPVLDDMSPVPEQWVEIVKQVSDRLTVPVGWQAQDVVMLDNSRFMHGRTEIHSSDGRMIATYFGYLDGVDSDPEEPPSPRWRKPGFAPPQFVDRGGSDI